jgi:hypothetical protein
MLASEDAKGTPKDIVSLLDVTRERLKALEMAATRAGCVVTPTKSGNGGCSGGGESSTPRARQEDAWEQNILDAFDRIDVGGHGKLYRSEIMRACRQDERVRVLLGLPRVLRDENGTRDALERVFQRLDADDSKSFSQDEFLSVFGRPALLASRSAAVKELFGGGGGGGGGGSAGRASSSGSFNSSFSSSFSSGFHAGRHPAAVAATLASTLATQISADVASPARQNSSPPRSPVVWASAPAPHTPPPHTPAAAAVADQYQADYQADRRAAADMFAAATAEARVRCNPTSTRAVAPPLDSRMTGVTPVLHSMAPLHTDLHVGGDGEAEPAPTATLSHHSTLLAGGWWYGSLPDSFQSWWRREALIERASTAGTIMVTDDSSSGQRPPSAPSSPLLSARDKSRWAPRAPSPPRSPQIWASAPPVPRTPAAAAAAAAAASATATVYATPRSSPAARDTFGYATPSSAAVPSASSWQPAVATGVSTALRTALTAVATPVLTRVSSWSTQPHSQPHSQPQGTPQRQALPPTPLLLPDAAMSSSVKSVSQLKQDLAAAVAAENYAAAAALQIAISAAQERQIAISAARERAGVLELKNELALAVAAENYAAAAELQKAISAAESAATSAAAGAAEAGEAEAGAAGDDLENEMQSRDWARAADAVAPPSLPASPWRRLWTAAMGTLTSPLPSSRSALGDGDPIITSEAVQSPLRRPTSHLLSHSYVPVESEVASSCERSVCEGVASSNCSSISRSSAIQSSTVIREGEGGGGGSSSSSRRGAFVHLYETQSEC